MLREDELYVKKIRSGTVIDHITAGHALDVLSILGIDGKGGQTVSVAMNVESKRQGRKDILKIEGRELIPGEVDRIALVAPKATINIVRDFKVAKKDRVVLPHVIKGIIKCANPACVSNAREPVEPVFQVTRTGPVRLTCHYCSRHMEAPEILKQF